MKTLRLAVIAAATTLALGAAVAQNSQTAPQSEQSGYAGCGSKARPAATS